MKKAMIEHATSSDGTEFFVKDIGRLINYIADTIDEPDSFILSLNIELEKIVDDSNTLDNLKALRSAYDTITEKGDDKEKFQAILNTSTNLYETSKFKIFERNCSNDKLALLVYLLGLFHHVIDDEKVVHAKKK